MEREQLIDDVCVRTGTADRELAARAIATVGALLAEALPHHDRDELYRELPTSHDESTSARPTNVAELHDAVGERLGLPRARAVELAQAVLATLAESLPGELSLRMKKHLPSDVAGELEARPDPPRVVHRTMPLGQRGFSPRGS
jgi:uncharacterized protein (DUF2267 family)